MQQHAHAVTICIGNEDYSVPTNEFKVVLDLIHSEFGENKYISYQSLEGLDVRNSTLPKEYADSFEKENAFLVCDPVVYMKGGDLVVAGNTNFHGMGEPVEIIAPKEAVSLESNVSESEWSRFQHKFEGYLTKEEVINPTFSSLPVEEVNTQFEVERGTFPDQLGNDEDVLRVTEYNEEGDDIEYRLPAEAIPEIKKFLSE